MKALELKPLEANLKVVLVEKEYEESWDVDQLSPREETLFGRPSREFREILEELIEEHSPDFATDELGIRSEAQFRNSELAGVFGSRGIDFIPVEMDDYAKPYLAHRVKGIKNQVEELMSEYSRLYTEKPDKKTQKKLDKMLSYGQHLQQKYEEELDEITYPIRQKWMAMGILDAAREYDKENITALHLCSPSYMTGMQTLLDSLGVKVEPIQVELRIEEPATESGIGKLDEYIDLLDVEVVPKKIETGTEREDIMFFFDTDDHASPFDICVATDAGFSKVIPYQGIAADSAKELVQDAIFSRGTKGIKHTSFFLGGSDFQEVNEILETVKETMFGPFQASVVIDPQGANTTGSALVAKVKAGLEKIGEGSLSKKEITIVAGTGPVGRVVAMLCASEGADVKITSRSEDRAKRIAGEISSECDHQIDGVQASDEEEMYEAVKDADVIFSTGPPGIKTITKDMLEKLTEKIRLVADANAVPPTGIEGLDPSQDVEEFMDGIYGLGALAAGNLKNKIEMDLLVQAKKAEKGIFDHWEAYDIAKERILPTITSTSRKSKVATSA